MWSDGNGNGGHKSCLNVTHLDKINCLTTKQDRCPNSGLIQYEDFCRYLTRSELEQAQTVPIGYTDCLSYNQACAVLGNGWCIDIICHILKEMKINVDEEIQEEHTNLTEAKQPHKEYNHEICNHSTMHP
jgi:hypothetical protein